MPAANSNDMISVGVFSHEFQGPYSGELVNQLRQLCVLRNIRFIGFCTASLGEFHSEFATESLDAAIIIRNSVSDEFAKKLLQQGTVLVSIAYDYFPLDIPVIDIDHNKSVDLAFDYLLEKNHKSACFIGNLRNYSVRKRYERFLERMEQEGISYDEDLLIAINSSELRCGLEAGYEFIKRGCNASAVLTESSQVTIGFINALRQYDINLTENYEVIGYGAAPLVSVLCPSVTTIDENLHLVAYRALLTVNKLLDNQSVDKTQLLVEPKLIREIQEDSTNPHQVKQNPYLSYSVDIAELYEPNYLAGLINNSFGWSMDIVDKKLENLMSIAPVFEKYMKEATFTHLFTTETGESGARTLKHFTLNAAKVLPSDLSYFSLAKSFPPEGFKYLHEQYNVVNHFFVCHKNLPKAVLSIYGDSQSYSQCSSYIYFAGQMQAIAKIYSLTLTNQQVGEPSGTQSKSVADSVEIEMQPITWDVSAHLTEWSSAALALLDMTMPMDVNIYRNMEIHDRIMDDDLHDFRLLLAACATSGEGFCTTVQMRTKSGSYKEYAIQAESIREDGAVSKVQFGIGLLGRVE
ncbi:Ribose operon repressor [Thalassocella blandensis]|nr:Ribose operon repressor [Thalassocella blandensis]